MNRSRCDKGFPRATVREMSALYRNCMSTCKRNGLTELSTAMAWYSACIDHNHAARCYAAIARSYERENCT